MRVVEVLEDRFENLDELTIAILCGKGNNGGDGFVVARQLIQKGCFPFVFLFAAEEELKGDAKTNLNILKGLGLSANRHFDTNTIGTKRSWSCSMPTSSSMRFLAPGRGDLLKVCIGRHRESGRRFSAG